MKIIHTKGPKAQRDRDKLTLLYNSYCRAFPWYQPITVEAMKNLNNVQLHALCRSVWDEQTAARQNAYMELCRTQPQLVVKAPRPLTFISVPELAPLPEVVDTGYAVVEPKGVPFVNA